MHPLDKPYAIDDTSKQILEFMRSHLHKRLVSKRTMLQRHEYIFVWDESDEREVNGGAIKFEAGKPFHICLCCSPFNGPRTEQLAIRAIGFGESFLNQFKRYYQLVKKSDAVALYGVEIIGEPTPLDLLKQDIKRFKSTVHREIFETLELEDTETGRKVKVKIKNGNAFEAETFARKLLRVR